MEYGTGGIPTPPYDRKHMNIDVQTLAIIGLILAGTLVFIGLFNLPLDSSVRRKRRRSYGKVVARVNRPVVLLNAHTHRR